MKFCLFILNVSLVLGGVSAFGGGARYTEKLLIAPPIAALVEGPDRKLRQSTGSELEAQVTRYLADQIKILKQRKENWQAAQKEHEKLRQAINNFKCPPEPRTFEEHNELQNRLITEQTSLWKQIPDTRIPSSNLERIQNEDGEKLDPTAPQWQKLDPKLKEMPPLISEISLKRCKTQIENLKKRSQEFDEIDKEAIKQLDEKIGELQKDALDFASKSAGNAAGAAACGDGGGSGGGGGGGVLGALMGLAGIGAVVGSGLGAAALSNSGNDNPANAQSATNPNPDSSIPPVNEGTVPPGYDPSQYVNLNRPPSFAPGN